MRADKPVSHSCSVCPKNEKLLFIEKLHFRNAACGCFYVDVAPFSGQRLVLVCLPSSSCLFIKK